MEVPLPVCRQSPVNVIWFLQSVSLARGTRQTRNSTQAGGKWHDPVEERKAQKLAQHLSTQNSFEAICREWHSQIKQIAGQWPIAKKSLIHLSKMFSRTLVNAR